MPTDQVTQQRFTVKPRPAHRGAAIQWDVSTGPTVIGTITSPQFGVYTATNYGVQVGEVFESLDLAETAVVVAHCDAAARGSRGF